MGDPGALPYADLGYRSSGTMSSFFTPQASRLKRKRKDVSGDQPTKKRSLARPLAKNSKTAQTQKPPRDESISSTGSEDEVSTARDGLEEHISSSASLSEQETPGERRLRLAEQYLDNIKGEVDEAGFDAEQIDKDLIAERLREDVVCAYQDSVSRQSLIEAQGRE